MLLSCVVFVCMGRGKEGDKEICKRGRETEKQNERGGGKTPRKAELAGDVAERMRHRHPTKVD